MRTAVQSLFTTIVAATVAGCAGAGAGAGPAPAPARAAVDTVFVVDTVVATPLVAADALRAGRFDNGKMWTFEYPPMEYFREAYDFRPDSAWFEHARLAALRLPGCTASFVSARGLVLTNHHCGRGSVFDVTRPGERLVDEGFLAETLADERSVADLYVDQLITVVDVSDEFDAVSAGRRSQVSEAVSRRIAAEYGGADGGIEVEIVELWNGAVTKAYVFHRFSDIRLVFAPELQLGYFGGDSDNFTYPRYALDMTFFRVYVDDEPYEPEFYFPWTADGVEEGDAVFVIGNPGSTARLETVAQLEFRRDVSEKAILDLFTSRIEALEAYSGEFPEEAEQLGTRNRIFGLMNAQKLYTGRYAALNDPIVMVRRADTERKFRTAVEQNPRVGELYRDLWDRMAEVQARKAALHREYGAFLALTSGGFASAVARRGYLASRYLAAQAAGAPTDRVSQLAGGVCAVGAQPAALQVRLLTARLRDLVHYLGDTSRVVQAVLEGRTPEAAARLILERSILSDSTSCTRALDEGTLTGRDPAVRMMAALTGRFDDYQQAFGALLADEQEIALAVGLAWFEVYGTAEPPDATFSLRMADGVVKPYDYNGTVAPAYTTFYGLYDHYYSYGTGTEWDLPQRWLNPPASFDLSTPLNFVSTADIVGGNSGSPVINVDLELVGVAFDGNIESLSGDYIYLPKSNRAVSVDARGMIEALEDIYGAARLVDELIAGRQR